MNIEMMQTIAIFIIGIVACFALICSYLNTKSITLLTEWIYKIGRLK